ncbi:MAG: mannose-1-phosphate guanylyltransferase [Bacteroidales bacterium]|nr:mannose-1-phosphate guanylyltransferase [Bacteroidales bacterium]
MKNPNYYCVIMAGGVGSRFWPLSKKKTPKQFIDILGDGTTLIQKTFNRFAQICLPENIYIVTHAHYVDLVKEQLPQIQDHQLILEPLRRNTAPCIAYANFKIKQKNPNAIIVVAPSDHIIEQESHFLEVISNGLEAVSQNDWMLTIGIRPSSPNTGYGYIQYIEENAYDKNSAIYEVKMFTEKPEIKMAKTFIESGDFLWNAGIFMWSLKTINHAFEEYLPEVNELFKGMENQMNTPQEKESIDKIYPICRNISIDYGIMEKADNVYVYASDFGWSDLGTWGSLYEIREKNMDGNAIVGSHVKTYHTKNCIVNVPKNKAIILQGLEDYIVVENDDVLLICKREEEQQIREFVNDVEQDFGEKYI